MKIHEQDRKVVLIIYNYPAHPHIKNLKTAKLIILPPNTTLISQPMNQGVI